MSLEIETEFFLRTIEDAGAKPKNNLMEIKNVNIQVYLSPDYSTTAFIRIDNQLITKSDAIHILRKLKLLELAPALFS